MPSVICSFTILPITIATCGIPWIKFEVPSIGSITIVSPSPLIEPDSSVIKLALG